MTALLVALCALVGLAFGSFANVVIWRVPRGQSVVSPPSACPRCGARIRPWQNIPVVAYVALRGRCAACREPISLRYPLIEAATAVLFTLVALWRGWSADLPAFLLAAFGAVVLTVIDIEHRRLPNAIVLPAYPALAIFLTGAALADGSWWSLLRAGLAMAALGAFYLAIAMIAPRGMGMGDVKLAGALGLLLGWIGWGALVVGAFAAFVVGALAGLVVIAVRGRGRGTAIPFGPWMIAGAALGAVCGEKIAQLYLGALDLA